MPPTVRSSDIADMVLGHRSAEECLHILDAVERDTEASRMLDTCADLLTYAEELRGRVEVRPVRSGIVARQWKVVLGYSLAAAVGGLALTVALLRGAGYWWGSHPAGARIDRIEFGVNVRAVGQAEIAEAFALFDKGEYAGALDELGRYRRAYPGGPSLDYVLYLEGGIRLFRAQSTALVGLGLYDQRDVRIGLELLGEAVLLAASGRLAEESRWLRAKGFLMQGRAADALEELRAIEAAGGVRAVDAARLRAVLTGDGRP